MIYTNLDNFYVSREDLRDSPSRKDGVAEETETELRIFGTTLIQEGGCLLKLPEVVPATGQVLFHRFYCKESMAKFDVEVGILCSYICWIVGSRVIFCSEAAAGPAESGMDMLLAGNQAGGDPSTCPGRAGCVLPPTAAAQQQAPGGARLLLPGTQFANSVHCRVCTACREAGCAWRQNCACWLCWRKQQKQGADKGTRLCHSLEV